MHSKTNWDGGETRPRSNFDTADCLNPYFSPKEVWLNFMHFLALRTISPGSGVGMVIAVSWVTVSPDS